MAKFLTQEEFVQKVKNKYGDKFEVVGNYVKTDALIKIKHTKCGTVFDRSPNSILSKRTQTFCPICDGYSAHKALVGINDLWTVNPKVASMLKNPDDGYIYTQHSGRKTNFICPNCGGINYKIISHVTSRGLCCIYCNKGKSYPNKIMSNLLKELNVDFIPEYIIKPYSYRYDFYFIFGNKEYIVEMDGGIGHGNVTYEGEKDINGIINDANKDKVCLDNGITMIRIDCNYKHRDKKSYIINHILHSKLAEIFNLSNIDFDRLDYISSKSTLIEVAELWNSGIHTYKDMSEILKLNRHTLREYAIACCEKGLIKDDYESLKKEIRRVHASKNADKTSIHVLCNETGIAYKSITQAKKECHTNDIHNYLKGILPYSGHLPDGTKLTWKILDENEYQQYLVKQKESI